MLTVRKLRDGKWIEWEANARSVKEAKAKAEAEAGSRLRWTKTQTGKLVAINPQGKWTIGAYGLFGSF